MGGGWVSVLLDCAADWAGLAQYLSRVALDGQAGHKTKAGEMTSTLEELFALQVR